MEEILDRGREDVSGSTGASSENVGEQATEGGSGFRAASEAVAVVSASALAGGGIGMLAGVALEAINPFALGIMGAVVGIGLPVLFRSVVGARRGSVQRPWWRRTFGG